MILWHYDLGIYALFIGMFVSVSCFGVSSASIHFVLAHCRTVDTTPLRCFAYRLAFGSPLTYLYDICFSPELHLVLHEVQVVVSNLLVWARNCPWRASSLTLRLRREDSLVLQMNDDSLMLRDQRGSLVLRGKQISGIKLREFNGFGRLFSLSTPTQLSLVADLLPSQFSDVACI